MSLSSHTSRLFRAIFCVSLLLFTGTTQATTRLPQDAYIWQQRWTPSLEQAIQGSADIVHAWHVRGAEMDVSGHLKTIPVDLAALKATQRPVELVVRIDGQFDRWDRQAFLVALDRLAQDWRKALGGLAGIEIDYDCPTMQLPAYAGLLGQIRTRLGAAMPLTITALPAWLGSRDFDTVLALTDGAVLQIHSVLNPRNGNGLFDPLLARGWTRGLSQRTTKPFWIALPAYASRVIWRQDGRIDAISSEVPRLSGGGDAKELVAPPQEISQFAREMEATPFPHLAGIVWFRLPTSEDRRAWSPTTWHAVLTGAPLDTTLIVDLEPGTAQGMRDIWLVNHGTVDATLPLRIALPAGCRLGDGVNAYALDGATLHRSQAGLVPPGGRQRVGWMRCPGDAGDVHVQP